MNLSARSRFPYAPALRYSLLCLLSLLSGAVRVQGQSFEISLPLDRSVYQRDAANQGRIPLAIQFYNPAIRKFTYKVEKLDHRTGSSPSPVLIENRSITTDGLYRTTLQLAAGWYQVVIQAYDAGNVLLASGSVKTGVGEVFFSAGQSNIQGIELGTAGPPLLPGSAYDALGAVNQNCFCKNTFPFPVISKLERGQDDTQQKIAPNGNQNIWCYEVIGRHIADRDGGLPVLFFNAASTGTTAANWSESADNPNAVTHSPWTVNCNQEVPQWASEGPEGHPYKSLRTALNFYGGMFGARVVLWHQGESDNLLLTTADSYRAYLKNVIMRSRQHFSPDLGWAISRAAHFPPNQNSEPVVTGQAAAKNETSNATWGAHYSDNFTGAGNFRQSDDLHFNAQGLLALGEQFAKGSAPGFPVPPQHQDVLTLTPVAAGDVPDITVSHDAEGYLLTVTGSHDSYCWVQDNGNINNCVATGQTFRAGSGKWRCYVVLADPAPTPGHEKKRTVLTPNVRLPLTNYQPSLGTDNGPAPVID